MNTDDLFYVVGHEKDQVAFYSGWWHTYNQPLFTNHPDLGGKKMRRANANRVRRRLEDIALWGGKWYLVPVQVPWGPVDQSMLKGQS